MNKILFLLIFISTTAISQMAVNNSLEVSGIAGEQFCDGLLLLNQVPNRASALFSDTDCDACGSVNPLQIAADNFRTLTDGYISELVIYVGYFPADMPLDTDEWTVTFHTDTLNQPGFEIYSEVDVASIRSATGAALFGVDEYSVVLTLESPVALDAGNYWVEIHNNSVENTDSVFWVSGSGHTNSRGGTVYSSDYPAVTWNVDPTAHFGLQLCDVVSDTIYLDGFEMVIES